MNGQVNTGGGGGGIYNGAGGSGGSGIIIIRGTQEDCIPVKFNGKQLKNIIFDGKEIAHLIFNGTTIYMRRLLGKIRKQGRKNYEVCNC